MSWVGQALYIPHRVKRPHCMIYTFGRSPVSICCCILNKHSLKCKLTAYFMSHVILWKSLKCGHISCILWMSTGTLHITSLSLEPSSSPTQLIFEACLIHKLFFLHSFTCNPNCLGCILSMLLKIAIVTELYRPSMAMFISDASWPHLLLMSWSVSTFWALSLSLRSFTVFDTIFDVLCILLLAGGGISIFDMRRRAPLFPKGASCRPIPRPILGAPGLLLMISLYSLNSGVWNSQLAQIRVNLQ